jgi:hypothetical protein
MAAAERSPVTVSAVIASDFVPVRFRFAAGGLSVSYVAPERKVMGITVEQAKAVFAHFGISVCVYGTNHTSDKQRHARYLSKPNHLVI